jgi:hypothetical protein
VTPMLSNASRSSRPHCSARRLRLFSTGAHLIMAVAMSCAAARVYDGPATRAVPAAQRPSPSSVTSRLIRGGKRFPRASTQPAAGGSAADAPILVVSDLDGTMAGSSKLHPPSLSLHPTRLQPSFLRPLERHPVSGGEHHLSGPP